MRANQRESVIPSIVRVAPAKGEDEHWHVDAKDYLAREAIQTVYWRSVGFIDWNIVKRRCRIGRITMKAGG